LPGAPAKADVGNEAGNVVVLKVVDSEDLSAKHLFIITVAFENDAPTFTGTPVAESRRATVCTTYPVTVDDDDLVHGQAVMIKWGAAKPSWLYPSAGGSARGVEAAQVTGKSATHSFIIVIAQANNSSTLSLSITRIKPQQYVAILCSNI
jgi:hypothetical protein